MINDLTIDLGYVFEMIELIHLLEITENKSLIISMG